jgi:hypothetical protein
MTREALSVGPDGRVSDAVGEAKHDEKDAEKELEAAGVAAGADACPLFSST